MFSRNKAILMLTAYGFLDQAELCVNYANKQLMYFPENNLSLLGVPIRGHFTIAINEPMRYRNMNMASLTKYSDRSIFGDDVFNIGNMEQDGHGMMMLSNYNIWKSKGSSTQWVEKNWEYIKEAADWILWCFEHEDLSYATDYVLYAESEGVKHWMGYSLYCNQPCYLGLLGYIEMAEAAGKTVEAEKWKRCAELFDKGILNYFTTKDGKWDFTNEGKDRDPTLGYMRYLFGYDINDMNQEWLERTKASYNDEINDLLKCGGYWGPWGTGYDHCTILQNALFLDRMEDATELMNNLSKICYMPRHHDVYGVPEAFAVDTRKNIVRRTGDFQNQIHMSEAMSCYLLALGVSPVLDNETLKIMPRLPNNWNVSVDDFLVQNTNASVSLNVMYPKNHKQKVKISFSSIDNLKTVKYRLGPFPMDTKKLTTKINGEKLESKLFESGDKKWAWVEFEPKEGVQYEIICNGSRSFLGSNSTLLYFLLGVGLALVPCGVLGAFLLKKKPSK